MSARDRLIELFENGGPHHMFSIEEVIDIELGAYAQECRQPMAARLDRIAQAHHKYVSENAGLYSGLCNECEWTWPCPTYIWATTDRDPLATWDPEDDDTERVDET